MTKLFIDQQNDYVDLQFDVNSDKALITYLENPNLIKLLTRQSFALAKKNAYLDITGQELLSIGFLTVAEKIEQFDHEKGDLLAFILSHARFAMLNEIKKRRVYHDRFVSEAEAQESISQTIDQDADPHHMSSYETQLDAQTALSTISNQGRYLLMSQCEDMKTVEMAKVIDKSVGWTSRLIKTYENKVKENLRRDIEIVSSY